MTTSSSAFEPCLKPGVRIQESIVMHKAKNIKELQMFCMKKCSLQVSSTLLGITVRGSVLLFSPAYATY